MKTHYYIPAEDSYLILKQIKHYAQGSVLDMGTGSGILAREAVKYADKVIAVDVNKELIQELKKLNKDKKITYKHSNLFSNIKQKFNLIIFNPPYLPKDKREAKESALTTTGGKKGYEIIEKFLNNVKKYLKKDGKVLLLFSSLSKKSRIQQILKKNKLKFKQIARKGLFFEKLYVYLIQ